MVWGIYVCPGHCQSIDAGYSDFGRMFFVTSLSLAIIADSGRPKSLADEIKKEETSNIPKAPQAPMSK